MREIKFKAIAIDTGEWVYGYYIKDRDTKIVYIIETVTLSYIKVYPETVCQYTGLKDKNGVEIYEGDEIEFMYCGNGRYFLTGSISFNVDEQRVEVDIKENCYGFLCLSYDMFTLKNLEVVSNIYDKEQEEE